MHRENKIAQAVRTQYMGTINIYPSPLPGVEPLQLQVASGTLIADCITHDRAPFVCIANGLPLAREYWLQRRVMAGDVIDLHPVVLGSGSRSILALVATVLVSIFAPYAAAAIMGTTTATLGIAGSLLAAGIALIGSALINAVIAPKPAGASSGPEASSTYSVALSGNTSRLNQPIPVGYGRVRTFPDYAAQPYAEYDTSTSADGDQYFYGLYALGHGDYDITALMIGDTDIKRFSNVEWHVLPPGTAPTLVNPAVVNAVEVGGQVLSQTPVGVFPACGPVRKASHVGVDFVFPRGLANINSSNGNATERSITVVIDAVEINDAGAFLGEWFNLGTEEIKAASITVQRRSFKYALSRPMRVAVRVSRTTEQSTDVSRFDECQWGALRGYLADAAPLAPTVTHIELRIKANEQMSGANQRKVGVLWQRKVRTWAPGVGFSEPQATRNPMWALLDKWTNTVYGDRLPIDRIDLEALYEVAQTCEARRDRFDFLFDTRTTSFEADALIARVCRSTPMRRNGRRSVIRDELQELPITAYTARNIVKGSASMQYMQVTEETADGVIVEYFDRNAWDWLDIECPAPGRTYTHPGHAGYDPTKPSMANPVRLQLPGVTGPLHAEREGLYHAAANVLRRKYGTWTTELQGTLAWYGAPVLFAPTLHNAVQSGDCAFYENGVLTLSEPVTVPDGGAIVLMRPNGTLTDPIAITPAGDGVRLASEPDFPLVLSDSRSERTKYVIVDGQEYRQLCKVLAIRPRGKGSDGVPIYEMFAVVDSDELHRVDLHLLPSDDPDAPEPWAPGDGGTEPAPEVPGLVNLTDIDLLSTWYTNSQNKPTVRFESDGRLRTLYFSDVDGQVIEYRADQWYSGAPVTAIGSKYEFQVTAEHGWFEGIDNRGGYSDWVPLVTGFTLAMDEFTERLSGTVKIRDAATKTIQATAAVKLEARTNNNFGD